MSNIHVEALYTYPVKSCAPIDATEFTVTEQGFAYDREWVVTRPNGTFLSQRTNPELALVETAIVDDELVLHAPSNGTVRVPLTRDASKEADATRISIFEKTGTAYAEDLEACDFLSDYLGKAVQLKRSARPRPINPKYRVEGMSSSSRFADGFPFLLASTTSLELLSEQAGRTIPMIRFRPNIVVSGDNLTPYQEDFWRDVQIGAMAAKVVKACSRCPTPDVDPASGTRDSRRIVKQTLERTRSGRFLDKEKVETFFGQNLVHVAAPDLVVRIGDTVAVAQSWRRNFNLES